MSEAGETMWYSVGSDSWAYAVRAPKRLPKDMLAEKCAADYHRNHDGWESKWPLRFFLREEQSGPVIAVFDVQREEVPEFNASEIELDEVEHE